MIIREDNLSLTHKEKEDNAVEVEMMGGGHLFLHEAEDTLWNMMGGGRND